MMLSILNQFLGFADNSPPGASLNCGGLPGESSCNNNTGLPTISASAANVQTIFQIVFGILGAVAVIYIILSSIRMITAQGDPQSVQKARQGILYAAVGLVIALSAELIVTFVLNKL